MRLTLRVTFSLYSILLVLITVVALYAAAFQLMRHYLIKDIGQRMESVAATAAIQIDGDLHQQVTAEDDVAGEAFQTLVAQMRRIRTAAGIEEELYSFRPEKDQMAFVIMTHETPFVGDTYDFSRYDIEEPIQQVLKTGRAQHTTLYRSSGDDYISGLAPIKNSKGVVVGILCVDFQQASFHQILFTRLGLFLKASLGVLIAAVLISLFAVRLISGPIGRTIQAIDHITASKDLTSRIENHSHNELGQLSTRFNHFTSELQGLIQQVLEAAEQLLGASNEVAGKGHEMRDIAKTMRDNAGEAERRSRQASGLVEEIVRAAKMSLDNASAVTESNQRIGSNMSVVENLAQRLSDAFKSLTHSVGDVSHTIQDVRRSVEETSEISHEAARITQASHQDVAALEEAAGQIGNVVDLIAKVAEKTNLLALNASIEAAHAGEAGKGFAVVANEILELAQQTSQSTKDIRERISKMQDRTEKTSQAIGQITEIMATIDHKTTSVAEAVEVQTQSVLDIETAVTGVNELADEVSQAVTEAAGLSQNVMALAEAARDDAQSILTKSHAVKSASDEVEHHAETVCQDSMRSADHAESLGVAGNQLKGLAIDLRERLGLFKVSD